MYHNSGPNNSNDFNLNNFKLYPSNPSDQYRFKNFGLPNFLAPFYNQKILTDDPSNVLFYSGSSGISSNPVIEIPNTGERFNFSDSEGDVYSNVVLNFLDESKKLDPPVSDCHLVKSKYERPKISEKDENELFGPLKSKLVGLRLREHPCEICSKNGYKSLFDDDQVHSYKDSQGNTFVEPCKHTSLKNIPAAHPLSKPVDVQNDSVEYDQNNLKSYELTHRKDVEYLPLSLDSSKTGVLNIEDVSVDHLLTYRAPTQELKRKEPVEVTDIQEFIEHPKNLNDLSPIQTNPLREVLLNIAEMKHLLMHDAVNDSFSTNYFSDLPVISLKDSELDYKKLDRWKYPTCYLKEVNQYQKLQSDTKDQITEAFKEEDDGLLEIQEYLRNNDISVDVMLQKYVQLRKSQCSKQALKALKHLICVKLNKQKLYYNGQQIRALDEESQESLFDKVLTNINRTDQVNDSELLKDDSSLYTYSSISLSSYESISEHLTFAVSDNDFFSGDPNLIHSNTLDAYGWLTVSDDEVRSQQNKILYCELVGSNFSLYPASYKSNYKSITSQQPLFTVHLDDHFSLVRKKDPKKNKICLKLHGTLTDTNDQKSPSRQSREFFWKHNGTASLKLEADTQNELMNWFTFLISRSRVRPFFTYLHYYNITPFNNTTYFLLYPKRKELVFNRLSYDPECEDELYKMFMKNPFNYVDFSLRDMEDKHLLHHMNKWTQPVHCINLSQNNLNFSFDPQLLVEYINKNNVKKIFLDKNPLGESSLSDLISSVALKTKLSYVSFRGCKLFDSLIGTLKKINKSTDSGKLVIDFRQCELSADFESFATGYPLNNLQILVRKSREFLHEYEMEYFVDNKDLSEISVLGSIVSGRLLSTQWRVRKGFRWPFSKKKNDEAVDVYFEYKAPYLIWHNWFPRNKRFSIHKKGESTEESSKLTESQAVFVKDIKKVTKDDSEWLVIRGKIPEKFKTKGKDMKIVAKGYTDTTTNRWYEIIRRWVAGVSYVDYILNRPAFVPCKHILSFCSRIDTPELILNGLPSERKFLMRFLSYMSEQTSLKAINFSNMSLDTAKLQFESCVLKDMNLNKIDWSFNCITLDYEEADKDNLGLLNALLPRVTVNHYDISHNPLGDNISSSKIFFRVLALKPEKISFNYCRLSNTFLTRLTEALIRVNQKFESVKAIELEGNKFEYENTVKFVEVLASKFPDLVDLRLFESVNEDKTHDLFNLNPFCNFERASKVKPEVGDFTGTKRIKKSKNTTRQSFSSNTNN